VQLRSSVAKEPVRPVEEIFCFDEFELNPSRLELRRAGQLLRVDALVLRLLACLVQRSGRLVTKDELVNAVWDGRAIADNAITVAMARLRKALEDGRGQGERREFVATVYGHGYRFVRVVELKHAVTRQRDHSEEVLASVTPAPFVGRARLIASMERALSETSQRRGRACMLIGEPGIGKTRAVEAFERSLVDRGDGSVQVTWGYCREGSDTPPLWPWLALLRGVLSDCDPSDLQRALGPAGLEVLEFCREPLVGVAAVTGATGAADAAGTPRAWRGPDRHRGFDAILRAFVYAAEQRTRVLVLDDLHRADSASLELLAQLLDEIARTKLLVVATLRRTTVEPEQAGLLGRVLGHRSSERSVIERLRREDVASYVGSVLPDPDGQLAAAVFAKSEGNPFFMVELSRQLLAAERPDATALAVGDAALELIRQRVSRLDAEVRGLLSAAAVIGRSFELPLLQTITERDPSELMTCLDAALAAEVLVAAPDSRTDFAFGHELLRGVLYDALTPAARRQWHRRIAGVLETRAHVGGAVPPSELAYHFYSALPESDLRKTVQYCRQAASASSHYGNPDVVRYLHHALEALAWMERPSLRLRTSLLLTSLLYARGCAHRQYESMLYEVLRLSRELKEPSMLVRAAHMLDPHPGFEPLPGAHEHLTYALTLLPAETAPAPRALALATLACTAPDNFSQATSHALMAEAEQLAEIAPEHIEREGTWLRKLYLFGGPDHVEVAASLLERLERAALKEPQRFPVVPIDLAFARAIVAQARGESEPMREAVDQAESHSRRLRHVELIWHCNRLQAISAINRGATSGVSALARVHQQAHAQNILGSGPFCAFDASIVLGEFGRVPVPAEAVQSALQHVASDPPSIWSLKVRALAAGGYASEARFALQTVPVDALAQLPCDRDYLGTLAHLARAVVPLNVPAYADALYRLLARFPTHYSGDMAFYSEGSVPQLLGMLAYSLGDVGNSVRHFKQAVRMNDHAGLQPRAAEARWQLARSLLELNRQEHLSTARGLLQRARMAAEQLQLPRLMLDVDAGLMML